MRIHSKKTFLDQFEPKGLALDARYHPPQTLIYPATHEFARSRRIPMSPKKLPPFVTSLFEAAGEENGFYLYPRSGAWAGANSLHAFQISAVLNAVGGAPQSDDVLFFPLAELDAAETLFTLALTFGGTVSDDIFAVPSHGQLFLYADHHEAVHAEFSNEDAMNRFLSLIGDEDEDED